MRTVQCNATVMRTSQLVMRAFQVEMLERPLPARVILWFSFYTPVTPWSSRQNTVTELSCWFCLVITHLLLIPGEHCHCVNLLVLFYLLRIGYPPSSRENTVTELVLFSYHAFVTPWSSRENTVTELGCWFY